VTVIYEKVIWCLVFTLDLTFDDFTLHILLFSLCYIMM